MADQSDAHSNAKAQVKSPDKDDVIDSVWRCLSYDMADAAQEYAINLEDIRASIVSHLVCDLLDGGRKQFEVIHFVRMVIALWKHRRRA